MQVVAALDRNTGEINVQDMIEKISAECKSQVVIESLNLSSPDLHVLLQMVVDRDLGERCE